MTQRGIQSIEVGGRLLLALAREGRPMALKDLAQAAGMIPPKAHPYLVSFGKLGLIDHKDMIEGFRYSVVAIFVLSALITPPDPFTQVMLAIPMVLLYVVGIAVAYFTSTKVRE